MAEKIIIIILVAYLVLVVAHMYALTLYASKHYATPTAGQASLIFLACLFWPLTWIWYGFDRLRGRVS